MAQVPPPTTNHCNSIKERVSITHKDIVDKKQFLQEDKRPKNSTMAADAATSSKGKGLYESLPSARKTRHAFLPSDELNREPFELTGPQMFQACPQETGNTSNHGRIPEEYVTVPTTLDPTRHTKVAFASRVLKTKRTARQCGHREDRPLPEAAEASQDIHMEAL